MTRAVMTKKGYEELNEKLKKLKMVDRQQIIKEIQTAVAHGDLSENAEYDAAKEKQGFIESKISEIEQKLSSAEVIDTDRLSSEKVVFGAKVMLKDLDRDEQLQYQIVGVDEADVTEGKISVGSPVARALIGKEEGDFAEVKTPNGIRNYEVLNITF